MLFNYYTSLVRLLLRPPGLLVSMPYTCYLLFTTTRYQICAPCIVLHYTTRGMGGRDEEFRKGGWLAICREQGYSERELMGQKSTEGLFHFFLSLIFIFAYLDFGAIWDDTVPARLSAVFVLGAGMVKDSSPGGMNHPHVFKYPHDRADFKGNISCPHSTKIDYCLRYATTTKDCAHCCLELNGRGL